MTKRMGVTISVGKFSNIRYDTEAETGRECILDIINWLSRVHHYEIDEYIEMFLLPLLNNSPKDVAWYKRVSKRRDLMKYLDEQIGRKYNQLQHYENNIYRLKRDWKEGVQKVKKVMEQIEELKSSLVQAKIENNNLKNECARMRDTTTGGIP